ncbi:hypothetical protein BH10ACI1_BH10ACI1_21010 [soil metagenome]
MKLQRFISIFFILSISFQICLGQTLPKSNLVFEFEKVINDELLAIVDSFMIILNKNNSNGYVVLYGTNKNPTAKYINKRRIEGCFLSRKYSSKNISFVFIQDKDKVGGQFWEIPKDAVKPEFNEVPQDYKITNLSEPNLIYKVNNDNDYCPIHFDLQFYSLFLNANPEIVGKIVIYEKTIGNYRREKQKYLQELTKKHKILPKQIKFVRGKYNLDIDAEFWLVPAKKK